MKMLVALVGAVMLGCVALPSAAGAAPAGVAPLVAHQEPLLGRLLATGDRVEIDYTVTTAGVKAPTGTLYIRNDLAPTFARVPLARQGATLHAVVPSRLLHGHKLFYYAIVTDPKSGRSVKVPRGAPRSAWILDKAVVVRLGTHRFGDVHAPGAVVVRAAADQFAFDVPPLGCGCGPGAGPDRFLVGQDRSIWVVDGANQRLLVWAPGRPDVVARTVTLPTEFAFPGPGDVALGPAGSLYVTRGTGHGKSSYLGLFRLGVNGATLWQSRLAGGLGYNTQLRTGPDGTLYAVVHSSDFDRPGGDAGWMPVANPAGMALSVAAQRRGILWGSQPVAGGLRLITEAYLPPHFDGGPHEYRFALIDRKGRIVRSWRVRSADEISAGYFTPALVGGDPVVDLTVARPGTIEHIVLRLAPGGIRTRFSLAVNMFGDYLFTDLALGPDGALYQFTSSTTTGVSISRYSLS